MKRIIRIEIFEDEKGNIQSKVSSERNAVSLIKCLGELELIKLQIAEAITKGRLSIEK